MMKCIKALGAMDNMVRPVVYLGGGVDGYDDWQQGAMEILRERVSKGTILSPRAASEIKSDSPEVKAWDRWNYSALDIADVVSYWFDGGKGLPVFALFDLGRVIGRYHVGGGPKRVIIGAHSKCGGRATLAARLDVSNETLEGIWRIPVHETDLESHIERVAVAAANC